MTRPLRSRLIVVISFALISFGQAYPFALAYAHSQTQECSCNRSGRQCIHGCDLKKRKAYKKLLARLVSPTRSVSTSSEEEPCHGKAAKASVAKREARKDQANWASPNCAKQNQQKLMNFQGDPFIPINFSDFTIPRFTETGPISYLPMGDRLPSCDEPPPKE